jgi:alpha-ketoglutarate-dependent taurine dioxygenase
MRDPWTRHRVSNQGKRTVTALVTGLTEYGFVLFDGVTSSEDLLRLAHSITTIVPHRDSDPAGLTTIADRGSRVLSGLAGFSACALNPHTDRSGIAHPPALLMMSCGHVGNSGGECVLIDGEAVYHDLAESDPEALKVLRAPRSVLFGGATGYLGSVFTRTGDRITVRLRLDELASFSPEVAPSLPALHAATDRHANVFKLNAGQGYIVDNHRWLHGRRAFTGRRVMYRVTGNPLPQLGIEPGFRPVQS